MCCLFATMVMIGPRAAILVWWLIDKGRWEAAFDNFIWAFVGFVFAPWTTLMWVLVERGGLTGFDWVWLGLAILADISTWTSGAWSGRQKYSTAPAT